MHLNFSTSLSNLSISSSDFHISCCKNFSNNFLASELKRLLEIWFFSIVLFPKFAHFHNKTKVVVIIQHFARAFLALFWELTTHKLSFLICIVKCALLLLSLFRLPFHFLPRFCQAG